MTLDPAAKAVLDMLQQPGVPPLNELPVPIAREAYAGLAALAGEPGPVVRIEDLSADGVPVKVYWPEGKGPHPVFLWLHGGGWALGSAAEHDAIARDICRRAGCMVVNVDYRLAPEHPFPAALDDVTAAARWVIGSIAELGGDPARLAVGGDSAGANLSTVLARELPGTFALQVLAYPPTDLTLSHPSIEENGEGYLLTKAAMSWFQEFYVGPDADLKDPRLSPLYAELHDLAGSAPALVFTAGYDPLRDEGIAYVERLREAGVEVDHVHHDGMIHAFYVMPAAIPAARDALDRTVAALQLSFGSTSAD